MSWQNSALLLQTWPDSWLNKTEIIKPLLSKTTKRCRNWTNNWSNKPMPTLDSSLSKMKRLTEGICKSNGTWKRSATSKLRLLNLNKPSAPLHAAPLMSSLKKSRPMRPLTKTTRLFRRWKNSSSLLKTNSRKPRTSSGRAFSHSKANSKASRTETSKLQMKRVLQLNSWAENVESTEITHFVLILLKI